MVDLHAFYYRNESRGIWKWNGGEGSRLESECKRLVRRQRPDTVNSALVRRVIAAGKADWGGIKYVTFSGDGSVRTPWGDGKWGDASSREKPNSFGVRDPRVSRRHAAPQLTRTAQPAHADGRGDPRRHAINHSGRAPNPPPPAFEDRRRRRQVAPPARGGGRAHLSLIHI